MRGRRELGQVCRGALGALLVFLATIPPSAVGPAARVAHAANVVTFTYTGGPQTWVVPAGVTSAVFEAYGSPGGENRLAGQFGFADEPGRGAVAVAVLAVTPFERLQINVGGVDDERGDCSGGFNGGGAAGFHTFAGYTFTTGNYPGRDTTW